MGDVNFTGYTDGNPNPKKKKLTVEQHAEIERLADSPNIVEEPQQKRRR